METVSSKNSVQPAESEIEKLVKIEIPPHDNEPPKKRHNKSDQCVKEAKSSECNSRILTEDIFGQYFDENGEQHLIKRFTWKNKNKIQVQVINYGARITSIKMPDRTGVVDDIVLGFDDLGGYIYNKQYYLGATIGRMTNRVRNSTFQLNSKQLWLTPNDNGNHHIHGGKRGMDQAVWNTYTDDTKVIMTHVSPHLSEGYPGDLFVRITFQLSERNEFKIHMEAVCSEPTIVNLSNFTYFNLAGHHRGADELYKHILTLNCNCFTPQVNNLPTGEIVNVIHTDFDFQIPKMLGKVIGISAKDGINQNLCVNRGTDQDECFVGRMLHPPTGRLMEIYSNQYGINISTANEFGFGRIQSMNEILPQQPEQSTQSVDCNQSMRFFDKVYSKLASTLKSDQEGNYVELRKLVSKIKEQSMVFDTSSSQQSLKSPVAHPSFELTFKQKDYLQNMLDVMSDEDDEEQCDWLKTAIGNILKNSTFRTTITDSYQTQSNCSTDVPVNPPNTPQNKSNKIPTYYKKSDNIIGKGRKVYKMHGGIALQTQNYPCCANFSNFPKCTLYPGENYTHTITYKFWIRAGNPNRWIKRNLSESKKNLAG